MAARFSVFRPKGPPVRLTTVWQGHFNEFDRAPLSVTCIVPSVESGAEGLSRFQPKAPCLVKAVRANE